ncbi:MAG: hypothetical protein IGS03_12910 [Candidatus Sericytochromatia bacterium]|nr:hypothetical protein [Candidatus Sericytochromatia bacterium]
MSEFYLSANTRQQLQDTAAALALAPDALISLLLSQHQLWARMQPQDLDPAFEASCQQALSTHQQLLQRAPS